MLPSNSKIRFYLKDCIIKNIYDNSITILAKKEIKNKIFSLYYNIQKKSIKKDQKNGLLYFETYLDVFLEYSSKKVLI